MKTGILAQQSGKENPTNLLLNGNFGNWTSGTTVAPDAWTLGGASATIAQEATIIKLGTYSAKLTRAGTDCYLYQAIHAEKGINYYKGRKVTFGCWVYATVADRARIWLADSVVDVYSAYHPGDSAWHFLTVSVTVDNSATYLRILCKLDTGNTSAYFDGAICIEGESIFAFADKPAEEGVWADYSAVSTIVGWTTLENDKKIYIKKIGKTVFVQFMLDGTSDSTSVTFTLPYTISGTHVRAALGTTYDNGAHKAVGLILGTVNGSTITCTQSAEGVWTSSGRKIVGGQFFFNIA